MSKPDTTNWIIRGKFVTRDRKLIYTSNDMQIELASMKAQQDLSTGYTIITPEDVYKDGYDSNGLAIYKAKSWHLQVYDVHNLLKYIGYPDQQSFLVVDVLNHKI